MRDAKILVITVLILLLSCAETSIDSALRKYNKGTVPYITVAELAGNDQYLILDAREKEEYNVSHIPGALWVGYDSFTTKNLGTVSQQADTSLVVYCSVGVRSEDIGERLIKNGFTDVKNLYGGIFEWKNQGMTVIDSAENSTQNVHAYSKYWGNLLTDANKVY